MHAVHLAYASCVWVVRPHPGSSPLSRSDAVFCSCAAGQAAGCNSAVCAVTTRSMAPPASIFTAFARPIVAYAATLPVCTGAGKAAAAGDGSCELCDHIACTAASDQAASDCPPGCACSERRLLLRRVYRKGVLACSSCGLLRSAGLAPWRFASHCVYYDAGCCECACLAISIA